jgi:hypothetical protein
MSCFAWDYLANFNIENGEWGMGNGEWVNFSNFVRHWRTFSRALMSDVQILCAIADFFQEP